MKRCHILKKLGDLNKSLVGGVPYVRTSVAITEAENMIVLSLSTPLRKRLCAGV